MHFCHKRLTVHPVNTDRQQREELTAEMASLLVIIMKQQAHGPNLGIALGVFVVCVLSNACHCPPLDFVQTVKNEATPHGQQKQASKQRSARSTVSCTHGSNIKLAPERCVAYFCRVQASKSPRLDRSLHVRSLARQDSHV